MFSPSNCVGFEGLCGTSTSSKTQLGTMEWKNIFGSSTANVIQIKNSGDPFFADFLLFLFFMMKIIRCSSFLLSHRQCLSCPSFF